MEAEEGKDAHMRADKCEKGTIIVVVMREREKEGKKERVRRDDRGM